MNTNINVLTESTQTAQTALNSKDARPKVTYYNALVAARNGHSSNVCSANLALSEGNSILLVVLNP